jgi:hypothetical protein
MRGNRKVVPSDRFGREDSRLCRSAKISSRNSLDFFAGTPESQRKKCLGTLISPSVGNAVGTAFAIS